MEIIKQQLQRDLAQALQNPIDLVQVEVPKDESNGDYSSNLAFVLAKAQKKSPMLIGDELSKTLSQTNLGQWLEINALKGFINFKLKDTALLENLKSFNPQSTLKISHDKVLLEYVSANPTGPLHVGHGRWAAIGDSLAKILKKGGYQVSTEFYVNDAGNQIQMFRDSVSAAKKGEPIPENGYHGAYIQELIQKTADPVLVMMDEQKQVLENFRVLFDRWFSEKNELHGAGLVETCLSTLREKNFIEKRDGAEWFLSTRFGDDKDRVVVRENGEKTYLAADIAYHFEKFKRGYDRLINIWGADHHGYVARVQAAIQALTGKDAQYLQVIIGQLVSLFRDGEPVRMSKRTGEIVTLQELIDEIGVDAARYFMNKTSYDNALEFDLALAKKQSSENPVFYVQYAHARICSILRQPEAAAFLNQSSTITKLLPQERALIMHLLRFPEEIELICKNFSIQRLTTYAESLAQKFHVFYHDCRVLSEDQQLSILRLFLCQKVKEVLAEVLRLLGVSAPEKM